MNPENKPSLFFGMTGAAAAGLFFFGAAVARSRVIVVLLAALGLTWSALTVRYFLSRPSSNRLGT
jgi:hypothetical protein